MQRKHLGPQEVLAILDAFWDADDLFTLVPDHDVGSPCAARVPIALDLEPGDKACC